MISDNVIDRIADRVVEKLGRAPNEYLDTRQAAELLNRSTQSLEVMRHRGEGPAYLKHGRPVRYRLADIRERADAEVRRRTHT